MKKTTALWTFALLLSVLSGATAGEVSHRSGRSVVVISADHMAAPPQAAKAPAWKSREEYDASTPWSRRKIPNKKITLAEAFIQKYPNSDFKDNAYIVEMQTYQTMNQTDKAVDAARKAVLFQSLL